jgi:prepilin-type N-terminal cleavage/methylation domain-containing protein
MLNRLKKTNDKGFTIIEVMIVLAIAGLILLIVFLAVPALQRNARNTQRKNDAAGISAAVNEYTNNNNGQAPLNDNYAAQTLTLCTGSCTAANPTDARSTAKLGYYSSAPSITVEPAGTNPTFGPASDTVKIYENAQCNGNATATYASRDVAVVYGIESGGSGSYAWQCTGS